MMSITDAVITAVLGYGVVFAGLVALMFVIMIFGKAMAANNQKKKAEEAAKGGTKK